MKILKKIIIKLRNQYFNYVFVPLLRKKNGLIIGDDLVVRGVPEIHIHDGAKLRIENFVTLNSDNRGYHTNRYAPVKIVADRPDAEIEIGANTRIHGSCIHAWKRISIGKNCLIAANSNIFDANGHELCLDNPGDRLNTTGCAKPITIEDNVWIGINCIIMGGVTIGQGSVIGAGSVVTKEVKPFTVVAGNPARVIKRL